MQWYLLKTWARREEELLRVIRRSVPDSLCKECFMIDQERIWIRQKRNILHREPLFPGCVFLITPQSDPILSRIEQIPAIDRWIVSKSLSILRMTEEDGRFLEELSGKEHRVKLSYVLKDEQGNICKLSGPLSDYQEYIKRIQFKKRYAMIRHRLWGEERTFVLGILLKEDVNQEYLLNGRLAEDALAEYSFYRKYGDFIDGDDIR